MTDTPKLHLIPPHTTHSREVTDRDTKIIKRDAPTMQAICAKTRGYAVAHSQINDKDPLRFFVTQDGKVIVNPVITRHTAVPIYKKEGCLTFLGKEFVTVQRFYRCEVSFQLFVNGKLTGTQHLKIKGLEAQIFQHEIDHFNGKYVFEFKPEDKPLPTTRDIPNSIV